MTAIVDRLLSTILIGSALIAAVWMAGFAGTERKAETLETSNRDLIAKLESANSKTGPLLAAAERAAVERQQLDQLLAAANAQSASEAIGRIQSLGESLQKLNYESQSRSHSLQLQLAANDRDLRAAKQELAELKNLRDAQGWSSASCPPCDMQVSNSARVNTGYHSVLVEPCP